MKRWIYLLLGGLLAFSLAFTSCLPADSAGENEKTIVVTYSVLGSIVKELVGDKADVIISVPNGRDPHDWEPSAKDIENLNKASLIVKNGLEFEAGMLSAIDAAGASGVRIFTASDHVAVRLIGEGEVAEEEHEEDEHHEAGSPDPHLWTDPLAMKGIVVALADELGSLGIDVSVEASELSERLDSLDREISDAVNSIPQNRRKLVTGHESLGYYAQRYGFQVVGAIIPGISTQAQVSAADLDNLKRLIKEYQVPAIFTELGTNPAVAQAIGKEAGVRVVGITTHVLPEDGSYFSMIRNMTETIVDALR